MEVGPPRKGIRHQSQTPRTRTLLLPGSHLPQQAQIGWRSCRLRLQEGGQADANIVLCVGILPKNAQFPINSAIEWEEGVVPSQKTTSIISRLSGQRAHMWASTALPSSNK